MAMFGSSTTIPAMRPIRDKPCGQARRWITSPGPSLAARRPMAGTNDVLNNVQLRGRYGVFDCTDFQG